MRRFVIIGHDAPVEATFPLDDLPGAGGRLDVLCRAVTAALLESHGIRADAEITTVHQDALSITFAGDAIRNLRPDERSTAARFRTALEAASDAVGAIPAEPAPGIAVYRRGLVETLETVPGSVIQLHPAGEPITTLSPTADLTFVLSDHRSVTDEDQETIEAVADRRVSIGPIAVHADQAITIAHNYLDTDGYRSY